jgi:hypothetical protein
MRGGWRDPRCDDMARSRSRDSCLRLRCRLLLGGPLMGSIKELIEIIILMVVTGGPLVALCLCKTAKAGDRQMRRYQRRKAQR